MEKRVPVLYQATRKHSLKYLAPAVGDHSYTHFICPLENSTSLEGRKWRPHMNQNRSYDCRGNSGLTQGRAASLGPPQRTFREMQSLVSGLRAKAPPTGFCNVFPFSTRRWVADRLSARPERDQFRATPTVHSPISDCNPSCLKC
ncbi:hypothetical protein SDC9_144645 [bioreactor metagenome]|uniref:Uncharacterized protein n=1 Tax=bioreactor metagenome TaxID=1076179 RepID=A0A645EA27_9ZZZZ